MLLLSRLSIVGNKVGEAEYLKPADTKVPKTSQWEASNQYQGPPEYQGLVLGLKFEVLTCSTMCLCSRRPSVQLILFFLHAFSFLILL